MEQPENDPNRGVAEILEALRASEDRASHSPHEARHSGASAPLEGKGVPPSKASEAGAEPPAGYLMKRLEALESDLARERERSAEARARLEARETGRGEVEEQIKKISEALKRERESSHASGRIEALEARLDKMIEARTASDRGLADTPALVRAISQRSDALLRCVNRNSQEMAALAHWLLDINGRMGTFERELGSLGEKLDGWMKESRGSRDEGSARAEQNAQALTAELRALSGKLEGWMRDAGNSRGEAALALDAFKAALAALRAARGEPASLESESPGRASHSPDEARHSGASAPLEDPPA